MYKFEVTDTLSDARDFFALTQAVLQSCLPFGPVHSLQLVHNKRARRVSCLIELDSPRQLPALKRALGATGLDGSVYLEIPVCGDFERAGPAPVETATLHSSFRLADAHLP
jgi:hypothetical protein